MPLESAAETGRMNNIRNRATGIVNNDLIYSQVEAAVGIRPCRRFFALKRWKKSQISAIKYSWEQPATLYLGVMNNADHI